ncbi:TonB-dependent receptor [Terriglobus sp. TAA 43]|uniref:TonB-dependent receptor n=1 Tax=Terriglobus sp. TAA 43 TaxID=278961 RepID=UPI000646CAB5|nr:TonB-dependent receptor [Terriglobus sp. TAA 43]
MKRRIAVLGLCLVPTVCRAQSTNATISGGVTDSAGKLIPGADVLIQNDGTGLVYSAKTNDVGMYLVPVLPPGHYHVQVTKPGFQTIIKADVVLNVQSAVALNFSLRIGAASESVTVKAQGTQINTVDGLVSTVVEHDFVEKMPLNGRSFQSLLTLAPGVFQVPVAPQSTAASYSGEIVVNGMRSESNYFTVDGVSANTSASPGQFGTGAAVSGNASSVTALGSTQSLVSVDDLEEFRSNTSTFSAEFGRSPGGNFSLSTRSGTQSFHGSLYDYLRNDVLDANNWFNDYYGYPKGKERQNDFGGTLGGPVPFLTRGSRTPDTFFFLSYEGARLRTPQAVSQVLVPTDTLRSSSPAALQPLLNAFPRPNYGIGTRTDGFAYYLQSVSFPSSLDNISGRVDHAFRKGVNAFVRFASTPSQSTTYSAAVRTETQIRNKGLTTGLDLAISGSQSNQLRFNWTHVEAPVSLTSTNLGGATPLNLSTLPGPNGGSFPASGGVLSATFSFANYTIFNLYSVPSEQEQLNITDSHTWLFRTHTFKAGIDWRQIDSTLYPLSVEEEPTFTTMAQVLSNTPATTVVAQNSPIEGLPRYDNFAAYLQDEWKATSHLSISAGVRWDINSAPHDRGTSQPYTVSQITDLKSIAVAPYGTSLWKTDWTGIAPRLGLAWQAYPGNVRNTVVRLGGGTFYDTGTMQGSTGYGGVGYKASKTLTNVPYPLNSEQLSLPAPSVTTPYSGVVTGFDPNLRLPFSYQYSAAVEQGIDNHTTFTLGYVGSSGHRLLTRYQYYPASLGNTNFSSGGLLYLIKGSASSGYNSLQAKVQRSVRKGLQLLGSYTWSHSIDNASSNLIVYQLQRSNSDFDIRQSLQAAMTWDIPGASTTGVLGKLSSGWGLDLRLQARTALPLSVIGAQSLNTQSGQYTQYFPNYVAGQPIYLHGAYPGGRILNYAAFAAAPSGQQGNVARNAFQGFSAAQLDAAVRRDFALVDRLHLQFRGEAFNLTNHPQFGAIYNQLSYGATQFGRSYQTLNATLGGLNSLYQNGGPRSFQFMLKLSF